MICFILIFSFLFESVLSNIVTSSTLFTPLFVITSLTILYPYFSVKKINFAIVCSICGFIYDIIFTNSLFINTLSFGLCSGLIILGYNYINYNIYSSNILNIIVLVFYRLISYFLLCIVDFVIFNEIDLIRGIYTSLIINILYGFIMFIIIDLINKIFKLKN